LTLSEVGLIQYGSELTSLEMLAENGATHSYARYNDINIIIVNEY